MNLDEAQRQKISTWVAEGMKLSEIQNRIASELGIRITYMDVRFLVDDLKLTLKDIERPKPSTSALAAPGPAPAAKAPRGPAAADVTTPQPAGAESNVVVTVDQIARPGAAFSGKVTFSDGQKAEWYFDQNGRLGLVPQQQGYRPPQSDLQQFQMALESELSRMGF